MPSHFKSLRDERAFPKWKDLPANPFFHGDYHQPCPQAQHGYKPKKHWCLLGEIDGISKGQPIVLGVTDKDGESIPVAFHPNDFSAEWEDDVAIGKAVLIMYADLHLFDDQALMGVYATETRAIKVSTPTHPVTGTG